MNNNDLFIDTMDKINTIAKGKGFVNGMDWAKTAKGAGKISDLTLSSFDGCHSLRNLMAHGSAKDIAISTETLANVMTFLSAIAQTKVTPAEKKEAADLLPHEGDFVLIPFFDYFTYTNNPEKEYRMRWSCHGSQSAGYLWKAPEIAGIITRVKRTKTKFREVPNDSREHDVFTLHPHKGDPRSHPLYMPTYTNNLIIFRPLQGLVYRNEPLYTTAYKLENGQLTFTLATMSNDDPYALWDNHIYIGSTYRCRAYTVLAGLSCPVGIYDYEQQGYREYPFKLKDNLSISFPPKEGDPYYEQHEKWRSRRRELWGNHCRWWQESLQPKPEEPSFDDLPF
ncbi:MAG: hypothetical protein IJY20_01460 [Clostridia bacterium]|nr:hypothetical protein [Clostridia bacterium]